MLDNVTKTMSAKHKAIVQTVLSLAVVSLCLFKLVDKNTAAEEKALFWGGLSGILGYWLPSPPESKSQDLLVGKSPEDEVL